MNIIGVILGGGAGSRLKPLTVERAKPAVPLAGKYRLVDVPISNCINSDIYKIYMLTQYNSGSLHYHVQSAYQFDSFSRGFVRLLAAEQTPSSKEWFQGTADAVRQSMHHLSSSEPEIVVILSGDQLFRMDFQRVIFKHIENRADVTICTTPVIRDEAAALGILRVNSAGKITHFIEKPGLDGLRHELRAPFSHECYLASMGIYVFNYGALKNLLDRNGGADFGNHIIPQAIETHRVFSYIFEGYWKDIGTIGSFWKANLELTATNPSFTFYDSDAPIYTRARFLPPSKMDNCIFKECLIAEGGLITSANISRSVVGLRSVIRTGTTITNSVIMGNDFYEEKEKPGQNTPLGIGKNCQIQNAIIDKNARIGDNVVISPTGVSDITSPSYSVQDGVIVVPKGAVIPSDSTIGIFTNP